MSEWFVHISPVIHLYQQQMNSEPLTNANDIMLYNIIHNCRGLRVRKKEKTREGVGDREGESERGRRRAE